jgi:hypothetical protein
LRRREARWWRRSRSRLGLHLHLVAVGGGGGGEGTRDGHRAGVTGLTPIGGAGVPRVGQDKDGFGAGVRREEHVHGGGVRRGSGGARAHTSGCFSSTPLLLGEVVEEKELEKATMWVLLGRLLLEFHMWDQDKDGSGVGVRREEHVHGGGVLPRARAEGA